MRSARSLAFLAIAAAAIALHQTDWLSLANGKLLDSAFAAWRAAAPRPVPNDVVVIGIDVEDLRAYSEPRDFWHANYGRLFSALAQAKPAVVGLDVVFPERSYQHLIPGLDQALLRGLMALRAQAPLILARTVDDSSNFREIFAPYVAIAGPESVGSVIVCRDEDEVIRRFDENLCDERRADRIPSLAGMMAKKLGVEGPWRGFVNYRLGEPLQYLPFREALRRAEAEPAKLRAELEGRPVLLGFALPFEDRKIVPVDLARWEPGNRSIPGVLVHAQVLRSMLNGGLLQPVGAWAVTALVLAGAAFVFLPSGGRATGAFLLFVAGLGVALLVLVQRGEVLFAAAPMLAATGAVGWRFVTDSLAQARERATLRHAFGGYVSPQIMDAILAGRITPELGGTRRRVCILFSDIRSFTTRSENMPPEVLIEMLNQYFTEMTQSVHERGGTVDKFIGDGMMCFFGAPQPLANPAAVAEAAGRDMLQRLAGLNRRFREKGVEPIAIGIGLHLGDAVVGHVGSSTRHEYTAIGDAVNTASRIEGLTKGLGHALVVSRDVWEQLENRDEYVPLGAKAVKGRAAVEVYGYTGSRTEVDDGEQTWIGVLGSRQ
ncbi:MAG: adenylate/guanylate cyclase domain-containing protein [Burkholderiales bacterium]|nr:adenylate/guanylate cyclase domain-containing protein [Burkholderiales bacterium]